MLPSRSRFAPLICLVLAVQGACVCNAQEPGAPPAKPSERFERAKKALLASPDLEVAGSAVGYAGTPGRFYTLSTELAQSARLSDAMELLKHPQVVVRAAGMFCLATSYPREAVPALKTLRTSTVSFTYVPGGCVLRSCSEGKLATEFLLNANALDLSAPAQPLVKDPIEQASLKRFEASFSALIAEASELTVSGARVGRGASPGRFFTLATELCEVGELTDFLALLTHTDVVVRAAGMFALAQAHPATAAKAIKPLTTSKASLSYMPHGCTVETISEGRLAQSFLDNANVLTPGKPARPLTEAQ